MNEEFDPATGEIVSRAQLDFQLNARDSAEYGGERLGHLVSAGAFRQLVMEGEAPAPITGDDFKAVWSQAALAAWTGERIEAATVDREAGEEDPAESEPQHENVYDFFEKTYSPYYELADARISALNRERPLTSWCDQWWLHKSVVGRMVAAWYAWEDAFAAGGGAMSSWPLEHADRTMTGLWLRMDRSGSASPVTQTIWTNTEPPRLPMGSDCSMKKSKQPTMSLSNEIHCGTESAVPGFVAGDRTFVLRELILLADG